VVAIYQWSAIVAAIGFAKTHLNNDSSFRRRFTEAVFPVYIVHQTIIVLASQAVLSFQMRPTLEGPLIILVTFVFSYAVYELVRRISLLRPWFGLKPVNKEFRNNLKDEA
jgi:peptidoglycan/LPS O-acetylase OafA/YrhL